MRAAIFQLVNLWVEYLAAIGISAATIDQYWRYLLAAGKIAGKDPRDFTEQDVVHVVSSYGTRAGARAMAIRAMRSFFEWAEANAEILVNPASRIRVPRSRLGPAPRLSREDLERMWQAAEDIDPRARPTLVLLYYTGARVGSMCGVMPEHVRRDRYGATSIWFAVAKNDSPYELPIEAPEALEAIVELQRLQDWRPKMAPSRRPTLVGVGATTVWKWVTEAGRRAGVKAHPHLLRHTFASDLAADPTVDVRTWVEAMNHRDGSQLRRYAAPSEPRIRAALGRLGATHDPAQPMTPAPS